VYFWAFCSELGFVDGKTELGGNTCSILFINLEEMGEHALLDILSAFAETTCDVLDNDSSHSVIINSTEKISRLLVVVVRVSMGVTTNSSGVGSSVPCSGFVFNGTVQRVGFVVGFTSIVTLEGHTITLVVWNAGSVRAVDGDLIVVSSKSVSLSVGVREETTLEHLVERSFNSGNQVRRRESGLFSFSVVVFGVAVKDQLTNINQRVVAVGPDLGNIVDIESVVCGVSDGHDLNLEGPWREITISNSIMEVVGGKILIFNWHGGSFGGSPVLNSLVSLEMFFDEEGFSIFIDPFESVGRITIHVGVTNGVSTLGHEDSDLMESLGTVRPEIPLHVGVVGVGDRVSFLGVDEVRELNRVLNEKDGSVVTDHIVVSILSVEFDGKSSGITVTVICSTFSSNGGETQKARGALTDVVKELGLCVSMRKKL
jgi:hypothetical protein